jgi:putative transposase
MVNHTRAYFGYSEKKAYSLIGINRSSYRYIPQAQSDGTLKKFMGDQTRKKLRQYGVRQLHTLLKKEDLVLNHKKTEKIWAQIAEILYKSFRVLYDEDHIASQKSVV